MAILVGTPSSITTPPAGQVELFLDSTNNNELSYKDSSGNVFEADDDTKEGDPTLEIVSDLLDDLTDAVKCGKIAYLDFANTEIDITATPTQDPVSKLITYTTVVKIKKAV